MSEGTTDGIDVQWLYAVAGAAGLAATLALGPVDFFRAVYNQIIGDMPVLKRQLVERCRDYAQSSLETKDVEARLARSLGVPYDGKNPINPSDVSIETLFDHIEDYGPFYDQWVWARTGK